MGIINELREPSKGQNVDLSGIESQIDSMSADKAFDKVPHQDCYLS